MLSFLFALANEEMALDSEQRCAAVAAKQATVAAALHSEIAKARALIAKRKQEELQPLQER